MILTTSRVAAPDFVVADIAALVEVTVVPVFKLVEEDEVTSVEKTVDDPVVLRAATLPPVLEGTVLPATPSAPVNVGVATSKPTL